MVKIWLRAVILLFLGAALGFLSFASDFAALLQLQRIRRTWHQASGRLKQHRNVRPQHFIANTTKRRYE